MNFATIKIFAVSGLALALASCATVATASLENRLQAIGLNAETAGCMATDLNDRLSQDDVIDLTRYTFNIARADNALGVIEALRGIDNPRAVQAVGQSGFKCVTNQFLR